MKIGLIGQDFNPGKTGGTETYLRCLVSGLPKIDRNNQYITYLPKSYISDIKSQSQNSTIASIQDKPLHHKVIHRLSKIDKWDKYNSKNLDLMHFCFQHADRPTKCPSIVTFHDIQDSYLRNNFTKEELIVRKYNNIQAINNTNHIIAISEFTKRCLIEKYKLKDKDITVVHHGIEDIFYNINKKNYTTRYGHYFYYPAATWPHKNHMRLLKAFKNLSEEITDINLVFSGAAKQEDNNIRTYIKENNLDKKVYLLNHVPYKELPGIYASAYALVFPSLFEGFGIPMVEAMSVGCPVIASKTTSIPEVAGNAALYFDPTSTEDIAEKMKMIVRDNTRREQLILNGYKQANKFTKSKMVADTLQVYRKVVKM